MPFNVVKILLWQFCIAQEVLFNPAESATGAGACHSAVKYDVRGSNVRPPRNKGHLLELLGNRFSFGECRLLSRVQQTANEFNGFNAARNTPAASSTWEKHATHATDSSEFHAAKTNGCSCLGVDLKSMDYTPSNCRVTRDNTPVIMHVLLSQIFRI